MYVQTGMKNVQWAEEWVPMHRARDWMPTSYSRHIKLMNLLDRLSIKATFYAFNVR